jgi:hypothetical protein
MLRAKDSDAIAKLLRDIGGPHTIKIVWYGKLTGHTAYPPNLLHRGRAQSRHHHQRLARLGDDEQLPVHCLIDQAG